LLDSVLRVMCGGMLQAGRIDDSRDRQSQDLFAFKVVNLTLRD